MKENKIIINGLEQVNIGSEKEPYYIPKPTKEDIERMTKQFKKQYDIKHRK